MSTALRPVLRPNNLSQLHSAATSATYICQSCRHARLLRRPKRPYTFTQLVTLSDGSAFTMRTTSPLPVYRSSRDTRNAPLWNPRSADVLNVEADEAGRLAGFRSRFGTGYDASKVKFGAVEQETTAEQEAEEGTAGEQSAAAAGAAAKEQKGKEDKATKKQAEEELDDFGFEDDEGLLEMISKYGTADKGSASQISRKRQK